MSASFELHGVRILECTTEGKPPRTSKDATAIISAAWGYQAKLVVRTAASEPLRDWVRECNRGRQVWFVKDLQELAERLAPA